MTKPNYNTPKWIKLAMIFILALPVFAPAQVREILIGEKMPDTEITEIVNYPATHAKISDFNGKLLILDFWASWCAPCVGMFPRTDSLEKKFNGQVKFLPVSQEPREKVNAFLNHMFKASGIKPVSVVNDTLLSQIFRFAAVPYYVWIAADGRVVATTGPEEITAANIADIIAGKPAAFENRKDIRRRVIDYTKALFVLSNNFVLKDSLTKRDELTRPEIFSYSAATKYIPNSPGALYFDKDHFAVYNVTVDLLYRWCYDAGYYAVPVQGAFDTNKNHVFDINDPLLLNKISIPEGSIKGGTKQMDEWTKNNAVCYEIVYPRGLTWKQKMEMVKQDLDRYFAKPMGFRAHVEQRTDSNTAVLKCISGRTVPDTRGGEAKEQHDRYSYTQHNLPLSHLTGILNGYFFQGKSSSFMDKTGLTRPVDLELNCDMTNLAAINEALREYGLQFSREPNQIDVLVFTEAGH